MSGCPECPWCPAVGAFPLLTFCLSSEITYFGGSILQSYYRTRMSTEEPKLKKARTEEEQLSGLPSDWTKVFTLVEPRLKEQGFSSLKELIVTIFERGGFEMDKKASDAIPRMVAKIADGYNSTPYHNFGHATHVFLNSFVLLQGSSVIFTPLERAAMLFSALIHDLGHEGVPNMQLVKEDHPLASKYNKSSVAENFSIDEGLATIENEEYNIFGGFSEEEMIRFKELVRSIVLATDIGNQDRVKRIYSEIGTAVQSFKECQKSGVGHDENSVKLDSSVEANRVNLLCLIMKLADVGSSFQHVNTSKHWIHNFYSENVAANRNGRGPEVNAVLFLEDQEKFFHSYIKHLHSVVASTGMLPPPFIEAMDKNFHTLIGVWNSESAVMLSQWKEEKA